MNIKEIEFLSEAGGKTTVSTTSRSVDLIAAKTNASHLFHKAVIPEGKYKEIRLILDDNNGKIVKMECSSSNSKTRSACRAYSQAQRQELEQSMTSYPVII